MSSVKAIPNFIIMFLGLDRDQAGKKKALGCSRIISTKARGRSRGMRLLMIHYKLHAGLITIL